MPSKPKDPPARTGSTLTSPPMITCTPKRLPKELLIEAAEHALRANPLNFAPVHRLSRVVPAFSTDKMMLAVVTTKYWGVKGIKLSVSFLDNQSLALRRLTLQHMNAWTKSANVRFMESSDQQSADVRIHRLTGNNGGYWSYLGTDIRMIKPGEPTMNLEGFTEFYPESEFRRVVRHETGHTLGFPHEHLRRELVELIDREKAYEYFFRTQEWSREQVDQQVLTPLEESSLIGTLHPDPFSIMCYQIPGEITKTGQPIIGGTDIDAEDEAFAARIYPKAIEPHAASGSLFAQASAAAFVASDTARSIDLLQQCIALQREQTANVAALIDSMGTIRTKTGGPTCPPRTPDSQGADGQIDLSETVYRTKKLIAWDTGRHEQDIYTGQDLEKDLGYTESNKRNLEGPIEEFFFADVEADADSNDLVEATTVGDLAIRIYTKYIPQSHRK
jgi:hypothetical protein